MTTVQRNYREILREKLALRCQKNPRYSLRSFARDLDISAPRLSRVLNGKHGLSASAAGEIARKLGFSEKEKEYFCAMVESEHARASVQRKLAEEKVRELSVAYQNLGLDSFRIVADWYHLAILELAQVEGFRSEPQWIAKELGISVAEAQSGIQRLLRVGLLEDCNGVLTAHGSNRINPAGIPSDAVRKYHHQILEKAQSALEFQSVEERDFSSLTVAIDETSLPRVKKMIREFRAALDAELSRGSKKKRVYNLSIQFFGLQKKSEKYSSNDGETV